MNDKRLDIRNICQQREYLQTVYKPECFFLSALYLKGKDGRSSIREILLIELMVILRIINSVLFCFYYQSL